MTPLSYHSSNLSLISYTRNHAITSTNYTVVFKEVLVEKDFF